MAKTGRISEEFLNKLTIYNNHSKLDEGYLNSQQV